MQTKRKEMVDICRAVKLFIQTESAHTYTGQKKWFVSKQKKNEKRTYYSSELFEKENRIIFLRNLVLRLENDKKKQSCG